MTPTRRDSPSPTSGVLTRPDPAGQADYFDAVEHASLAALKQGGESIRSMHLAGETVSLRFGSESLSAALLPALAHHPDAGDRPPSLTVYLWDTRSTGVRIPRPPWRPEDYLARGDIRGWAAGVHAAYHLGGGTLSLFDPARGTAVFWLDDARALATWEKAAPIRTILGWFLRTRARELLHGGAVGLPSGGVLLAGRGGRGKSTTALASLTRNLVLQYAGDDYVAVESSPAPRVHSVYSSGKLDLGHAGDLLPELIPLVSNPAPGPGEKGQVFLAPHFPGRLASGFPLRAVILPEVSQEVARLDPVSPLAVLQELASTTMGQMPGTDQGTLRVVAELVRTLPCYRLLLGCDLAGAVSQIRRLVEAT
jgi:hypothetical protein